MNERQWNREEGLTLQAHEWIDGLPALVRPLELGGHAPRTANEIARAWHDHALTRVLLEDLLVGGHVGDLPNAVTGELLRLYDFHMRCRGDDAANTTWELPAVCLAASMHAGA